MIKTVQKMQNGMVLVFDELGQQMPQYQGRWTEKYIEIVNDAALITDFLVGDYRTGQTRPMTAMELRDAGTSRIRDVLDAIGLPKVVCLCGSTRFWREFQEVGLRETLDGNIVLSIGAARGRDDDDKSFGGYREEGDFDATKEALDALHLRKIELADEVIILNVGGYIGSSTQNELNHAKRLNKAIRYLEEPHASATTTVNQEIETQSESAAIA